jgi:hypothetical protein
MTKNVAYWMLVMNLTFLVLNIIFMMVGNFPTVNFVAGLMCLGGTMASYILYTGSDQP